jgi:hypothetical protein
MRPKKWSAPEATPAFEEIVERKSKLGHLGEK